MSFLGTSLTTHAILFEYLMVLWSIIYSQGFMYDLWFMYDHKYTLFLGSWLWSLSSLCLWGLLNYGLLFVIKDHKLKGHDFTMYTLVVGLLKSGLSFVVKDLPMTIGTHSSQRTCDPKFSIGPYVAAP